MQHKPVKSFPAGTANYGGILPHTDKLLQIALLDKTEKSDREALAAHRAERAKTWKANWLAVKREDFYIVGGIWFDKHLVEAYMAGFDLVPAYNLSLGPGISPEDEAAIREDPEWQQLATQIYDKLVKHITNPIQRKWHGGVANPNSWLSLKRKKDLLVQRLLIRYRKKDLF